MARTQTYNTGNRIKIVYITHEFSRTGAPLSLLEVVKENSRFENYIVGPKGGTLHDDFLKISAKLYALHSIAFLSDTAKRRYGFLLSFILRIFINLWIQISIFFLLYRLRPNIVYCNSFSSRFAIIPSIFFDTRVIWHLHEYYHCSKLVQKCYAHFATLCSTTIIANSLYTQTWWKTKNSHLKSHVLYSSVEILSENCTTFEERTNDIFIVGTISAEKGFNTILQALQLLHAKSISLNVAIAGSFCNAEYKELVKNYIENSGMKHRITFLNSITNVRDIMLQSKILVHASLRESFGRVLIEAMACKTPVIASKIGGIPEIIKSGVTGVLFDVGNAEMLTDDVLKLLQNENLWNLISENGYQFVRQNFNHDIFSSQLDKIISYSLIKY